VVFRRNHGKPVLDLTYLLNTTMQENKPLDWEAFEEMQRVQPLRVMASGLKSRRAFVMDMERGSFSNIEEMACCMRASCLLPGVAGPVMNMRYPREEGGDGRYDMIPMNNFDGGDDYEPLADALLFEPLPYRSAISEGATHVVCLRSRPDGVDVTGKTSIFEKLVVRRFLLRKNSLRGAYEYMKRHLHKKMYAEQVIELNDGAKDVDRPYTDLSRPHLLPIAVPPGSPEIPKLETGREAIFDGVRRGFARAYDALVEDPKQRGKGMEIAKIVFPDDILSYDPLVFTSRTESAYEAYLRSKTGG
jgi:predicted acylesterase/phospholipase RssA